MIAAAATAGFADPVFDSQTMFRAAILAMSRPGSIHEISIELEPPAPLAVGTAALALTLCDFETPLWLDAGLAGLPEVAAFLKFHTGAPIVADPAKAAFALLVGSDDLPRFDRFPAGTLDFPDRSTSLLIQVESLRNDRGWRLAGPGIAGETLLAAEPLPASFLDALRDNHRLYPRGLDLYFIAGKSITALPRTTLVEV